ncbi:LOW QUALITY PROTEIN: hypothetical protein V2J09_000527 [Rumex salicifolius]
MLLQSEQLVAFFSKGFSFSNRFHSTYYRELRALVLTCIITNSQQRLLLKLLPFEFKIHYKPGRENSGVDALSRRPHSVELLTLVPLLLISINGKTHCCVTQSQRRFYKIRTGIQPLLMEAFFYKGRLLVPDVDELRQKFLYEAHNTPAVGHGGYVKTLRRIAMDFNGLILRPMCDARYKIARCANELIIKLFLRPSCFNRCRCQLRFGKMFPSTLFPAFPNQYVHFLPLAHPYTAKSAAMVFYREIIWLYVILRSIVSDRDPIFLSAFWNELFHLIQTQRRTSSAYHPHQHLATFIELMDTMKIHDASQDVLFLRVFSFSLLDRAKA